MFQGLDIKKILLSLLNLLLLKLCLFDGIDPLAEPVLTFVDTGVATLSELFQDLVLFIKNFENAHFCLFGFRSLGFGLV